MSDLPGSLLSGRYRIEEQVGEGGMARVFKAWDMRRSVYLALKLLREDLAEDIVFVRRFQREARALSDLQHPHIVRFYGLEEEDERVFLLMDYIEGTTLRREIRQAKGPMPLERIVEILRPVCAALGYAHSQGLVHCDVKPANIMIDANGRVLLADFGIARMSETATTATMVGAGTPAYMAPEQIKGLNPTPQTDIYALGIVLYEMLGGGERPFTGEQAVITGATAEKVRWEHLNLLPPPLRRFNPDIPPELESVVLKCLEKEPAHRFAGAGEVFEAFRRIVPGAAPAAQMEQARTVSAPDAGRPPAVGSAAQPAAVPLPEQVSVGSPPLIGRQPPRTPAAAVIFLAVVLVLAVAGALWAGGSISATRRQAADLQATLSAQATLAFFQPEQAGAVETQNLASLPPSPTETPPPPTETPDLSNPPLNADSGETWRRPADGMEMVYIPAGEFLMGSADSDEQADADEKPQHKVYLDAFWIDQTEVTNAMFETFVWASGYSITGADWRHPQGPASSLKGLAQHPVVQVSWHDASTYCEWAGGRLPTEAEWEKAARGEDGRIYPWGDAAPGCSLLNYAGCKGDATAVGSYPAGASPYGLFDMAGNVWEWVLDWYAGNYYASSPHENPSGPESGEYRGLRGGAWYSGDRDARAANHRRGVPGFRYDNIGFRCAR